MFRVYYYCICTACMYIVFGLFMHLKRLLNENIKAYADPESFVRGGPTLTRVFLLIRGERVQIPL